MYVFWLWICFLSCYLKVSTDAWGLCVLYNKDITSVLQLYYFTIHCSGTKILNYLKKSSNTSKNPDITIKLDWFAKNKVEVEHNTLQIQNSKLRRHRVTFIEKHAGYEIQTPRHSSRVTLRCPSWTMCTNTSVSFTEATFITASVSFGINRHPAFPTETSWYMTASWEYNPGSLDILQWHLVYPIKPHYSGGYHFEASTAWHPLCIL